MELEWEYLDWANMCYTYVGKNALIIVKKSSGYGLGVTPTFFVAKIIDMYNDGDFESGEYPWIDFTLLKEFDELGTDEGVVEEIMVWVENNMNVSKAVWRYQ